MKFFEAVPDELFSPLASPNRALYADALDVLYTAYREKLKLPEDMLYSMLRSRLEQQLAEATFEGEDIDEDELRDISGRARFLIRKLGSKGWFEKEFYSEKMAKFIDFVHTTPVQVVCMLINVGLMAAALLIAYQQGTLGTTFMHLFG